MSLKAWEVGALRMAPLVTGATCLSRVSKVAVAPHALKVRVCVGGAKTDWWLSGSGALPQPSAAVEECQDVVKTHHWNAGHNPWPLWFTKRVSAVGESNCIFEDVDVRCVNTFQPPARLGHEAFAE